MVNRAAAADRAPVAPEAVTAGHRGRPRSAEADRAIAEATVELLGRCGYAELTMAGVAERAGVSTATLYRRFTSKEDLVVGALTTMVDRPAEPPDTGSLEGDLRALHQRVIDKMSSERASVFLNLAGELLRHPHLRAAVQARLADPLDSDLGTVLDRARRRGELDSVPDRDLAAALLLGPVHHRLLVTGEPIDGAFVDRIVPLVLRAFGAHPPEGSTTPA